MTTSGSKSPKKSLSRVFRKAASVYASPKPSLVFQGFYFLLTKLDKTHREVCTAHIKAMSGKILEGSIVGTYRRGGSNAIHGNCILVTSREQITSSSFTEKYNEAVAAGVPCLDFHWLDRVCASDTAKLAEQLELPRITARHALNFGGIRRPTAQGRLEGKRVLIIANKNGDTRFSDVHGRQAKLYPLWRDRILPLAGAAGVVDARVFKAGWDNLQEAGGCDFILRLDYDGDLPAWARGDGGPNVAKYGIPVVSRIELIKHFENGTDPTGRKNT